jgi:formate dehydrogenase maturation protein FdhE
MEISRFDDKTILIADLDLFFVELLRQIPVSADPMDSEAARERLYSKPAEGESEREFCDEWKSYVQPELRHLFASANKTVEGDLEKFEEKKHSDEMTAYALRIPVNHLDAWLSSLNQARLALAARYNFSDKELEATFPANLETARELSLLQIHFYGFLQEVFLREMK